MKHLEIRAWMVNEALGEPPLSLRTTDPAHISGLTMYKRKSKYSLSPCLRREPPISCKSILRLANRSVSNLVFAIVITFFAFGGTALAQEQNDPYCPNTDAPTQRLAEAVARSPHHATPEIGNAIVDVYGAYLTCVHDYKRKGMRRCLFMQLLTAQIYFSSRRAMRIR